MRELRVPLLPDSGDVELREVRTQKCGLTAITPRIRAATPLPREPHMDNLQPWIEQVAIGAVILWILLFAAKLSKRANLSWWWINAPLLFIAGGALFLVVFQIIVIIAVNGGAL